MIFPLNWFCRCFHGGGDFICGWKGKLSSPAKLKAISSTVYNRIYWLFIFFCITPLSGRMKWHLNFLVSNFVLSCSFLRPAHCSIEFSSRFSVNRFGSVVRKEVFRAQLGSQKTQTMERKRMWLLFVWPWSSSYKTTRAGAWRKVVGRTLRDGADEGEWSPAIVQPADVPHLNPLGVGNNRLGGGSCCDPKKRHTLIIYDYLILNELLFEKTTSREIYIYPYFKMKLVRTEDCLLIILMTARWMR